jgi:inosose dehydratase
VHSTTLPGLDVQIGANPILWSNDDFHDLGGDIPLEQCLREMHDAGYAGTELGHKFPRRPETLAPLLRAHDLQLVSGWHSLHLLEQTLAVEAQRFAAHLDLLQALGSRIAIVAECSRRVYHDAAQPLAFETQRTRLAPAEWERLAHGLEALADAAAARGMRLAYHHHVGTVVQDEPEIEELLRRTTRTWLLADTGHLAFAGVDPRALVRRHAARVAHVHLKNVRPEVVARARRETLSFAAAVRAGVFTVPGDGGLDFGPILEVLAEPGYSGWLVVEAEQDPKQAPPFATAQRARAYLRLITGL